MIVRKEVYRDTTEITEQKLDFILEMYRGIYGESNIVKHELIVDPYTNAYKGEILYSLLIFIAE